MRLAALVFGLDLMIDDASDFDVEVFIRAYAPELLEAHRAEVAARGAEH